MCFLRDSNNIEIFRLWILYMIRFPHLVHSLYGALSTNALLLCSWYRCITYCSALSIPAGPPHTSSNDWYYTVTGPKTSPWSLSFKYGSKHAFFVETISESFQARRTCEIKCNRPWKKSYSGGMCQPSSSLDSPLRCIPNYPPCYTKNGTA